MKKRLLCKNYVFPEVTSGGARGGDLLEEPGRLSRVYTIPKLSADGAVVIGELLNRRLYTYIHTHTRARRGGLFVVCFRVWPAMFRHINYLLARHFFLIYYVL